jgi:hypothetical protein
MRKRTSAMPQARAVALAAILLAGCTAGTGATPPVATSATTASTAPSVGTSTASPTASLVASPSLNATFTADDEKIATLISTGAEIAIPQLMVLNESDPSKLEDIFLPLGVWIASQKAGVESYSASACTSAAVARFIEGMDRYDAIRKQFLAWRDWGANGHAFPPGAPRQAHESFDAALAELGAHCPA